MFLPQARRADIKYEQDHNKNVDIGVYRETVNFKTLAKIGGGVETSLDEKTYHEELNRIK